MPIKLILDTDIGSDIDDAVALAYLLANPRCDLLGVTTVSGQPEVRARIVSALCMAAGRDVPVFPGAAMPLTGVQRQPDVPHATALAAWPHETRFSEGRAIEFIAETVRAHPGEVTLLSIGPMTNIASLFAAHPDTPGLLGALMIMGGRFAGRPTAGREEEWNVYCDPVAAAAVYRATVASHRSVGIEITTQLRMDAAEVRKRFSVPGLRPVLDMAEVYFVRDGGVITFHDPLAAVCVFDPAVCMFQRGDVTVEDAAGEKAGLTRWVAGAFGRHEVAMSVRVEHFFEQCFSVFDAAPA